MSYDDKDVIDFSEPAPKKPGRIQRIVLEFFDLASFFLMAMGIVLCIRFFIFSPFTVVGQSMEPTFHSSDFVIIDKVSSQKMKLYEWSSDTGASNQIKTLVSSSIQALPEIRRGDIIVFVPPGKDIHYIKRVIGLPGETVKIEDNDKVVICKTQGPSDCFTLDETYLPSEYKTLAVCGVSEFVVTEGFFVMGDNREHSTDSRCCFTIGCFGDKKGYIVPYDYIIGKVRMRILPDFVMY
ncbi:MAG: signal peptidase I [Candidatus Absconditabacterales bacterium]